MARQHKTIDISQIGSIKIDDFIVEASVFKAIVNPENRLLWRFQQDGNRIYATPIDERHVIWLDPEPEEET